MIVVFDTNIYVSGFTRPTGRASLALAADVDLIVTGDRAMLALRRIENTQIVALASYLDTVDNPSITG